MLTIYQLGNIILFIKETTVPQYLFTKGGKFTMTFEKAFESVKKKFINSDASGVDDFAVQITLTDNDCGGTFYAEVKQGVLNVEPYDYRDNNAALTISKTALLSYLGKRTSLDRAISDEGSSVYGDTTKVETLRKLVSVEERSYTRKMPTAQKETVETTGAETVKKSTTKKAAPKAKTTRKPRATKKTKK